MPRLKEVNSLSPALLRRFKAEAEHGGGDGRYYGIILRDNGDLLVDHPEGQSPAPEQVVWAGQVLKLLNKELNYNGAWVLVFTHPKPPTTDNVLWDSSRHAHYARFVLMWMDEDGDVQIPIEWMEFESELVDFPEVIGAGYEAFADMAAHAHEMWALQRQALDLKAGQTVKHAQGQARTAMH